MSGLPFGAAQGQIPGSHAVVRLLHVVGKAEMLERLVVFAQPGQRQTQAAQGDQRRGPVLQHLGV